MKVLVINAGSSSLKYQLFDMEKESVIAKGICDRIGIDGFMKHTPLQNGKPEFKGAVSIPTHAEAISTVIEKLTSDEYGVIGSLHEIKAIGHRVVHGGKGLTESVLIDDHVIGEIASCVKLAPLHIPANLMGINACINAMPRVPQVAVFDTAFHSTIPERAAVYAIPYKFYTDHDVRRYGYHGTSHRYVSAKAVEYLGGKVEGSRIISCHLGNGSSLAAVKDGKCIDTTMGLTPLEGLPMGTRCGSIDPMLIEILTNIDKRKSMTDTMIMLNRESGVLGISGVSSDFRDVETAAGININDGTEIPNAVVNKRARLALDIFNYHVAKFIGSYIIALGGLDALVFTAGIGENSPYTRLGVSRLLSGIGIYIDESKNGFRGRGEFTDLTGEGSRAKIFVIPTDEELVIARDTSAIR